MKNLLLIKKKFLQKMTRIWTYVMLVESCDQKLHVFRFIKHSKTTTVTVLQSYSYIVYRMHKVERRMVKTILNLIERWIESRFRLIYIAPQTNLDTRPQIRTRPRATRQGRIQCRCHINVPAVPTQEEILEAGG